MQALNAGQTLTDTFTATTVGGTTQLVTITINGANDTAVISGTCHRGGDRGRWCRQRHAGHPDRDRRSELDRRRQSQRRSGNQSARSLRGDSGFSTYTLTAAGVWTYTLDNSNAAVQALNVGQTLTDTFTAITVDGTAQLVTITITGTNDTAVDQRRHQRVGDRGRRRRQRRRRARLSRPAI